MSPSTYLHSFRPILPQYSLSQDELISWILKAHEQSDPHFQSELVSKYCLGSRFIQRRYFECADIDEDWESHRIYRLTKETPLGVGTEERNRFFAQRGKEVFQKIYSQQDQFPDHLIHVTCTGYISPSPGQDFFQNVNPAPAITHAYHMGCYASLPAIRMAQAFVGSGQSENVDVVHTEMCSLHLNLSLHTPEQMVIQTLFADGHIAYRLGQRPKGRSFKLLGVRERLIPDSVQDMGWTPGSHGMVMNLAKEVPVKIRKHLPDFLANICRDFEIDGSDLWKRGIFAIHPGGPKIIEAIQRVLDLSDVQVEDSQVILSQRGNMSSATLPHIWDRILAKDLAPGTPVLSLAFGPGLTIFGALLVVEEE